jgi:hypothetical protein
VHLASSIKPRHRGAAKKPPHDRRPDHHHGVADAKTHKDQGRPCCQGSADTPLLNSRANPRRRSSRQRTRTPRPQGTRSDHEGVDPATPSRRAPGEAGPATEGGPNRAQSRRPPCSHESGPTVAAGRTGLGADRTRGRRAPASGR